MHGRRWWGSRPQSGSALVEYALIVALIAVVSLLVIGAMGMEVFGFFNSGALGLPGSGPLPPSP